MIHLCVLFFFTVVHEYDYVFAENGLVAYKEGKQIGQEVRMSNRIFHCNSYFQLSMEASLSRM